MISLSPVIVLSVATRVQARRIELGTQAARTYIDGVSSNVIADPTISTIELEDVAAPTAGALACPTTGNAYCDPPTNSLYCVDGDGDNTCTVGSMTDMIVQAYGYHPAPAPTNPENNGYSLGVRVYRADAFGETGVLKQQEKAQTFTGGLGDRKAPIVEMTTEITTDKTKFKDFCDRITDSTC